MRRLPRHLLLPLLVAACAAPAPTPGGAGEPLLAIANVTVVDVERGALLPDRTVLVRGGRVASVSRARDAALPSGVRAVDGAGRYLIPGLWDMHVHAAREGRARHFWPLFLANGVTGVREMGSYLDTLRHWRAEAARPGALAPRIVWSSPMLDGAPTSWRHG